MLEVHPAPDGFTVYDTDAGEAVIKFASRAEADEMVAALQKLRTLTPSCSNGLPML